MKRIPLLATIGAAVALGLAGPALAHTKLVGSTPAAGATVRTGPNTITLTFNERIVPSFSKFTVSMPAHRMDVPVKTMVSEDGKRIVGTLDQRLGAGDYKISWTAAGSDGHRVNGELAFKVG